MATLNTILTPPSFRRRPESSGLCNPFPHSGNDNTQARQPNAPSGKTCHPFTPWPPLLDAGISSDHTAPALQLRKSLFNPVAVFIERAIIGLFLCAIFARHGDGRHSPHASLRGDGLTIIALIGKPITCLPVCSGRPRADQYSGLQSAGPRAIRAGTFVTPMLSGITRAAITK